MVVGDALLDRDVDGRADRLAPDAPVPVVHDPVVRTRPGGAALAARLVARLGARVTLVTGVGDDPAGRELRVLLQRDGVHVIDLGRAATPVKTRVRVEGHPLVRIDDGDDDDRLLNPGLLDCLDTDALDGVLVADYGRGVSDDTRMRTWLGARAATGPIVWDPHPRGSDPVTGVRLVTPNRAEVRTRGLAAESIAEVARAAAALAERWRAQGVVVTLGCEGAVLGVPGRLPLAVPAPMTARGDPCGAGDCFAAAAVVHIARGAVLTDAVAAAVHHASTYVATGGVASLDRPAEPADAQAAAGPSAGRLVATSGCFDLLHAGHVAMLQAARALGERLVVLLNSDRSVRALKGSERPIVGERDRASVLEGLECVDEVVVFDEPTPVRALHDLRPDVFVKGDDYGAGDIPESAVLGRWGGAVVVVPYLEGRSTTRLLEHADAATIRTIREMSHEQ